MSTKTATLEVQAFLESLQQPTQLVDSNGRLLGTFAPVSPDQADLLVRAAKAFDEGEGKRRFEVERGKGNTTAEVLAQLEGLGRQA
ncbi:MAG: hypothetical protein U0793_25560 [Gemmataceae bacterium]